MIVEKMSFVTAGRDDIVLDLTRMLMKSNISGRFHSCSDFHPHSNSFSCSLRDHSDVAGDLGGLKAQPITIKEQSEYRLKITFKYFFSSVPLILNRVQHEVVSGLKYHHAIYRKGIRCEHSYFYNLILTSYFFPPHLDQ